MHVTALELTDFRNYRQVSLQLGPGVTTFVGSNGQGKTNLVESIGYAATLRSHRVASDAPLVRAGAQAAIIRVGTLSGERRTLVELLLTPGRANRARLNRAPVARPRDVLGVVRRVIFAPEDLALVKGDPGERRAFLDDLLVSLTPRIDGLRSDLDRVLRQRNSLLKSAVSTRGAARTAAMDTLTVWDEQFVALACALTRERLLLVGRLRAPLAQAYSDVAGAGRAGQADIAYQSKIPGMAQATSEAELAELLTAELARRRSEEFARGLTLVGPQRDELAVSVGGLPVKGYASHGESWSMALALRLASYELLRGDAALADAPILVLDDVFAELDTSRRERLSELAIQAEQALITAAVSADVPAALRGRCFEVTSGELGGGPGTVRRHECGGLGR